MGMKKEKWRGRLRVGEEKENSRERGMGDEKTKEMKGWEMKRLSL
jgi:hypothetical protein